MSRPASSKLKYRNIAISHKIAAGSSTLAANLKETLGWKVVNAGEIQRQYDREHGINEDKQGAIVRPDEHERAIDAMTKKMLAEESNLIYAAWLAGFMAQGILSVLKVLLFCSDEAVRVDRVANRDKVSIEEAKQFIRQREEENIKKWKKLYGDFNFWEPKYFDVIIDTYSSGPLETMGRVLDKLGYEGNLHPVR